MTKSPSRTPIANSIIEDAIDVCSKKKGRTVGCKDLYKNLNLSPSTVWFQIKDKRSWTVDRWLLALQTLGCLSYQGDHIIINSRKFEEFRELFNGIDLI